MTTTPITRNDNCPSQFERTLGGKTRPRRIVRLAPEYNGLVRHQNGNPIAYVDGGMPDPMLALVEHATPDVEIDWDRAITA
jgi:hypothetical protein